MTNYCRRVKAAKPELYVILITVIFMLLVSNTSSQAQVPPPGQVPPPPLGQVPPPPLGQVPPPPLGQVPPPPPLGQMSPQGPGGEIAENQYGGQQVLLPPPGPESKNPSGVNMTEMTEIQQQMDDRVQSLEDQATKLSIGVDQIETMSPKNLFKGVDLDAEIIDPAVIGKQLEDYRKAQEDKYPASAKQAKEAAQAFVGELTPPIIILEPSGEDPLQKFLLMKLLTCKQLGKRLQERKQAISQAQKNLGMKTGVTASLGEGESEEEESED